MDKFDFLIFSNGKIYYGHLKASDGAKARKILEDYFEFNKSKIDRLELKGHTTSSFEINQVTPR